MNILVLYDSVYGNTEKIARAIARGIGTSNVLSVEKAKLPDLKSVDLLIVGSPTHGGNATPAMQAFLKSIPLTGMSIIAFDTGIDAQSQGWFVRMVIRIFGYASPKLAKLLVSHNGKLISTPETFFVEGKEGPLVKGELERAAAWGKKIVKNT